MESTFTLKNKINIVEELVEKQEMWTFTDTKCRVENKFFFKWNTLFQEFQNKEFKVFLQDDMSIELSTGIYKNISKYGLHRELTKTPVLPCPDVIKWMTRRVDHENRIILNFEVKNVASYQAPILDQFYHFKEAQVKVSPEWLKEKNEYVDFLSIMKGQWSEGQFRANSSPVEWKTSKL